MNFLNTIDLEVKAFFFNAKTDYLPYYKHFSFTINKNDQRILLKDLLPMIKSKNENFSYPQKDLVFRVNDKVVTGEEKLLDIVHAMGTTLVIDPVLSFRSENGLIINNNDFMHQYRSIFKHHTESREALELYLSLYAVHYASETFHYNHEYIGDAILVTVAKMIEKNPEHQEDLLHAINDEFNGIGCCEYENNLFQGEDYSDLIANLKQKIRRLKRRSIMDRLKTNCLRNLRNPISIESLEGKNIAIYYGQSNTTSLKIDLLKSQLIPFEMSTKLAGQTILESCPEVAYQKAGKMMLQAMDNGAEVLIFAQEEDAKLFKRIVAMVENKIGREINLALLAPSEVEALNQQKVA